MFAGRRAADGRRREIYRERLRNRIIIIILFHIWDRIIINITYSRGLAYYNITVVGV